MTEYFHAPDWRCPDCGAHEVHEGQGGDLWVVSCAGCGLTISDTYVGDQH